MAGIRTRRWYCSACEDLVKGQHLPWLCAFTAMGLLAISVGPLLSAAVAASAVALLLFVLAGLRQLAQPSPKSIHLPEVVSVRDRLAVKFSAMRATEVLVIGV